MFGRNRIIRFFSLVVMGLFICTTVMAQDATQFSKRQKRTKAEKGVSKLGEYYKSLGYTDESSPAAPSSVEEELGSLAKGLDALNAQNEANKKQQIQNDSELVKANQLFVELVDRVGKGLIKDKTDEFNAYVSAISGLMNTTRQKYGSGEAPVPDTEFVFMFSSGTKVKSDEEYYKMLNDLAEAISSTGAKTISVKAYGDKGPVKDKDNETNRSVATSRISKIMADLKKFHRIEVNLQPQDPDFSNEKNTALRKIVITL